MNSEILIELLKDRPWLYDMGMKKNSDHAYKKSVPMERNFIHIKTTM